MRRGGNSRARVCAMRRLQAAGLGVGVAVLFVCCCLMTVLLGALGGLA